MSVLVALAATAAVSEWDPVKAQALAQQLEAATTDLYTAVYDQPQAAGFGEMGGNDMLDSVRMIRSESMHLSAQLKAGKGMSETRGAYRRIRELVDDLDEDARQTFLVGVTQTKLDVVDDTLTQLKAFYGR
jgi:hypothetical protein